ncbi:undecaprenyl-diphosphatase [Acetitomaculum ruminis DSM 5522]|uniref:Undecaprenyl-diphosphatase n=1 Tax=Acetitomaculum ruminis DSM 5522 TaxID=1120918 RepID=A0A1I0YUK9_9FIRM|nr:phosphatase PAP2 family protein [Acetitomaculum ruminis]SFB16667.1 undecaprenyl-diphosphatase [Acetitomaculum ruminis DSM 5522]
MFYLISLCYNRLVTGIKNIERDKYVESYAYLSNEENSMRNEKSYGLLAGVFLILSIIFTIIVCNVDVAAIGPEESSVGLSTINKYFHDLTGLNMIFYSLSKYLGYLVFLPVLYFGLFGFLQLVTGKKLSAVDINIWCLLGLYIVFALIYVFFEKVIINYRPEILPDETALEASFPSTHTMLAIVILGSAIIEWGIIFKRRIKTKKYLQILASLLMVLIVVFRLLSGAHWLSDIFAGILYSVTILMAFKALLSRYIFEQ